MSLDQNIVDPSGNVPGCMYSSHSKHMALVSSMYTPTPPVSNSRTLYLAPCISSLFAAVIRAVSQEVLLTFPSVWPRRHLKSKSKSASKPPFHHRDYPPRMHFADIRTSFVAISPNPPESSSSPSDRRNPSLHKQQRHLRGRRCARRVRRRLCRSCT